MAYSANQLGYARIIVAVGRRMGVAVRGIKIGLSAGLVETNLLNYANRAVPGSLSVPHDAVGSDGRSVGILQQQPQWWGRGDGIDLMNPATAAALFFEQLLKLDYLGLGSPGSYAQAVQRSAYPARYDERFAEASALYDQIAADQSADRNPENIPTPGSNQTKETLVKPAYREIERWSGNSQPRGTKLDLFLLHTQEGDGTAESLAGFLQNPNSGVSYHYTVDNAVTVCDVVDTDLASWAVLSANGRSINLCFAGSRASWSRAQWLDRMGRGIEVAAWLAVQDCRKYGIPTAVIAPPYRRGAGISDHRYVTRVLGDGTHTDVGDGFPWDVFTAHINRFTNTTDGGFLMALTDAEQKELLVKTRVIYDQLGPNLWGPESSMGKTADGKELTLRDGLANFKRFVESKLGGK